MITNVIKRAKIGKQCLVTGLCVAVMAGCRISVPQAESSYKFVKDLICSDEFTSGSAGNMVGVG